MGLILDSSVVIASERLGKTAYQTLEAIGLQSNDADWLFRLLPFWS
jgi:hypothetical protein